MTENEEKYYVVGGSISDAAAINDAFVSTTVDNYTSNIDDVFKEVSQLANHEIGQDWSGQELIGQGEVTEDDDINAYWVVGGVAASEAGEEEVLAPAG